MLNSNENKSDRREIAENLNELARELVEYSFQKEAYQGHKAVENYLVAYTIEKARWLQYVDDEQLIVENPQNENAYIGIAVHHAKSLHFLDKLNVFVKVLADSCATVGEQQHFYHARPNLHNYGRNWRLPGDGYYDLIIRIEVPEEKRKEMLEDDLPNENVEVTFPHVLIQTGHHIS